VVQHRGTGTHPRQAGPHAHSITPDPAGRFALACDLGVDQVLVYRLDPGRAALEPNAPPAMAVTPGAGPRHLAFHPAGRRVYLINELASTLAVLAYDPPAGRLQEVQSISTLPARFAGDNTGAQVLVHPSGNLVYASNRGHDSIAVFAVADHSGELSLIGHQPTQGKSPRHFALDPSGCWVLAANQGSDSIVALRVDHRTGRLTASGQSITVGSPVCVLFGP